MRHVLWTEVTFAMLVDDPSYALLSPSTTIRHFHSPVSHLSISSFSSGLAHLQSLDQPQANVTFLLMTVDHVPGFAGAAFANLAVLHTTPTGRFGLALANP